MRRKRRTFVAIVTVAVLGLGVSACGGGNGARVASIKGADGSSTESEGSGKDGDSSGDKASFEDALRDYSRCMREHGIDMPDPTFGENGGGVAIAVGGTAGGNLPDPSSQVFKDAEAACKPILDRAHQSMPKPSAEELAKMRDHALAFARCMRDKGFDMPDPTFGDDGTVAIEIRGEGPPADGSASGTASNGDQNVKPMPDPKFIEASEACNQETGGPGIGFSTRMDGEGGEDG